MKSEQCIKINDKQYPQRLKEINSPPSQLYYKGSWDKNIFANCLAVVGSRKMTTYGRMITNKLVTEIAKAGITIVSGFMFGVDATAHKAAVDSGARTIAVMPCGINLIHPEYQKALHARILSNKGLIISEFKGKFPPALWTYPKRNRIVSGISQAVLVVEAAKKSGSLITADFAKQHNRKIFAVPGPLTSLVSEGTVKLIQQGAEIVTESGDILKHYNVSHSQSISKDQCFLKLNALERIVVKNLQQEPMEIDTLIRKTQKQSSEISALLSLMQMKGLIFKEERKYYVGPG